MTVPEPLTITCEPIDDDACRAHHRRLGFVGRRRHPGGPEDVCGARRLWRLRHHGPDRPEHDAASAAFIRCRRFRHRANRRRVSAISTSRPSRSGWWRSWRSIDAIAAGLTRWSPKHVVLDPVMVATSGDRLLAADAVEALRTKLIPRASLITPNLPEAAALLDEPVAQSEAAIERQGQRLLAMGCRAVLIKGGHGQGSESIDYLFDGGRHHRAGGAAHRDQKYPRHRMLAVVGHRGRPCQGRGPGNRGPSCQGLDQCRDRRGRSPRCRPRPRADPSFSRILLSRCAALGERQRAEPALPSPACRRALLSASGNHRRAIRVGLTGGDEAVEARLPSSDGCCGNGFIVITLSWDSVRCSAHGK